MSHGLIIIKILDLDLDFSIISDSGRMAKQSPLGLDLVISKQSVQN